MPSLENLGRALGAEQNLEERLRESEHRFEDLFEDAPVACHEIDHEGVVTRVNAAECELLGFQPHEMIGRHIWEFMAPDDRDRSYVAVRRKLSGEEPLARVEREYTRRDGATVFLDIHPKLIRNASGEVAGIRSFMIDNTARKRAEFALHQKAEELARSNAELEQFAYVASHDLQEPLRKILAFGERLRTRSADTLNEEGRDSLTRMTNAAARMQTLIRDLLTLSRVATQPRPFAAVDLAEVANGVLLDLEPRIEQVNGRVEFGPLPVIVADRMQMAQLLQNLIVNGLKFHKKDEPPVVRVYSERLGAFPGKPWSWRIVVEDNGIGFDPKYLDRIFQVFQRLHGRGDYEGSGIGLAICRKIAERHGGSITATSSPGGGARFAVTLPDRRLSEDLSGEFYGG